MKIAFISDTHGLHHQLLLPDADVLIHAGDVSKSGKEYEIVDFLKWFSVQAHTHKIFIAGNHDFYFEKESKQTIKSIIPDNIIYLNDSGITINGIHFWGSPITPYFFNWAFNRHRGSAIKPHWDLIPENIDVLITHGPVFRILDTTESGQNVGCKDLMQKVTELNLKIHCCGHIHEAYGSIQRSNTTFVNASVLDIHYQLVNAPIVLEI